MPLLRLDQIVVNIGTRVLLDHINLTLHRGVRIGLLGRNGEGKTTLMKIIAGSTTPDSGERWLRPGIRVAWLEQTLPYADEQTVFDMVADGLGEVGALLQQYHHLAQAVDTDLDALERVQHALEAQDGWSLQQRVDTIITQLELPAEATMRELSGGWRRRVMLGRALVLDPDILLLDEPTNHLDIPAIEWLEKQLQDFRGAIICVTHDRAFLQAIANRIMELDRGHLTSWDGTYHGFLRFREEKLAAEETANALFDKKLAEEEKWIRQGIKARRTRNEGRVRALKDLRVERSQRREQQGSSKFEIEAAARSGKIVTEVAHVTHSFGDKVVVRDLSCTLLRGDRIGIIGPNGAGKTTLLKILLGELAPQSGSVTMGTNLQVAYFDQLRTQLDPEKNLIDNVLGGQEFIELNGKRRHAITYLGDFLFTPDRVRTPVKALSGGEQARAILAKLFTRPANVLVLDEPTNDLDMETLDLLEELLLDFPGTVLLVSHDREFMDNTVTSVMVMTGNGEVQQLVGGYSDWLAKGGKLQAESQSASKPSTTNTQAAVVATPVATPKRKLSYKEKQQLDALPAQIDQLEKQQQQLEQQISDPAFYAQAKEAIQNTMQQLEHTQQVLTQAYERWQFLDS